MIFLTSTVVLLASLQLTFAEDINSHKNWKLVNNENCGSEMSLDRIFGGHNASIGQFPWMAYLGYKLRNDTPSTEPSLGCGGALITERHVITAAHCLKFEQNSSDYLAVIILGQNNIGTESCSEGVCAAEPQKMYPDKILIHEQYNITFNKNDIGLVRLKEAAVLNGWVTPICLPSGSLINKSYVGSRLEVAGWGTYDKNDTEKSSSILRFTSLRVLNFQICKLFYGGQPFNLQLYEESQLCIGLEKTRDSCDGDSGAPLVAYEKLHGVSRGHIIGLVSFALRWCGIGAPNVDTRIAPYIPWILDRISPE